MAAYSKNLVSHYGGVADGTTNNATALGAFNTFAAGLDATDTVTLTIPAAGSAYLFNGGGFLTGIRAATTISGYGATMTGDLSFLGSNAGFSQHPNHSARIFTAYRGATSVFCKTPAEAAFFPVGRWTCIGAQEWQGASGFPPNLQKMQFVKVTATNAGTGEVQFSEPLTDNYFDHFIDTHTPAADYDCGGPATLFLMSLPNNLLSSDALDYAWDSDLTVNGLTLNVSGAGSGGDVYCIGRRFVATDVTCTNCALIPTALKYAQFNNYTNTGAFETQVDKNIEYLEMNNPNIHALTFQSAGVMRAVLNNPTVAAYFDGTPRRLEVYGGSGPAIKIGNSYGGTESVIIDGYTGGISWIDSNKHTAADFTLSGDTLTYTGSGILPFGAERTGVFLAGTMSSNFAHVGYARRIDTVKANASNQPKHQMVPFPTLAPSFLTGTVYVVQHPCLNVTLRNIAGYGDGPPNTPLFSYVNEQGGYTDPEGGYTIWGTLVSIHINILRAYTGAQSSCTFHLGGQFGNVPVIHSDGTTAAFDFDWVINCKIAGERIITPTTVTGNQSGDTSSAPGAVSFISYINPYVTTDMSGDTALQKPLIQITMTTDQGVGRDSIAPLRLRLHA